MQVAAIKELLVKFELLKRDVNMVTSFNFISFFCVYEEQEYVNSLAMIDFAIAEFTETVFILMGGEGTLNSKQFVKFSCLLGTGLESQEMKLPSRFSRHSVKLNLASFG
jgi:hypothetical protein